VAEDPRESWFHERQSAWLYRQVAAVETDPPKVKLFESLAVAAEEQAETWARLAGLGPAADRFRPSTRARITAGLVRRLGVKPMRAVLVALKMRGLSIYDSQALDGHAMPTRVEQVGARHRGGGGNLRAAVFGINDGLVSNASLIMGVAGAGVASGGVLTTGVAGLLAGALSMAAGEYISVRSQRDMYEYQIGLEREELAEYPEEEAEELALIYAARGMDIERARQVARDLLQDPEHALDTLAREELGLNPDDLGSPWGAAASSFIAFAAGALVPLLPFIVSFGDVGAIQATIFLTVATLFGVGMVLSLFTGRNAVTGGLRMVAIGGGAGLITWLIGRLIGGGLA